MSSDDDETPLGMMNITPGGGNSGSDDGRNGNNNNKGTSSSNIPNVPVSNSFDVLSVDDDEQGGDLLGLPPLTPIIKITAPAKSKKARVPPISVVGKSTRQLREFLGKSKIEQTSYNMKATKSGVQLYCLEEVAFRNTTAALKAGNVEYHTYTLASEKPVKIILSGLPVYDLDELSAELAALGIVPSELKLFFRKFVGQEESALYLLHFPKGTIKLTELQKTKAIFNVIVRWRYYEKKPTDAVQCHRCQRFGHGMGSCNRAPLCVKCGDKHLSEDCGLPKKAELETTDRDATRRLVKCANCSGQHTANYRGCPTRKGYLAKLAEKKAELRNAQKNPPLLRPFPSTTEQTGGPGSSTVTSAMTYNQVLSQGTTSSNGNLFTMSEFLTVARAVFSRLQKCRSRLDQLEALVELTAKYIYNV